MKRLIPAAIILFFLCGCQSSPSPEMIQTALQQTLDSAPTETQIPTSTMTSTAIPSPTATATNTKTSTPVPTSTSTLTPTPDYTATNTPIPTNTLSPYQKTLAVQNITATKLASYSTLYWKDFSTYPDDHMGEKLTYTCRVFNIPDNRTIQCYFVGTYDAFYVVTSAPFSGLYENDSITVYGTVGGKECFENRYGAEICQPLLEKAFFTKP